MSTPHMSAPDALSILALLGEETRAHSDLDLVLELAQADCHYGYTPDEGDRRDMDLLHERFGIKPLPPYSDTGAGVWRRAGRGDPPLQPCPREACPVPRHGGGGDN